MKEIHRIRRGTVLAGMFLVSTMALSLSGCATPQATASASRQRDTQQVTTATQDPRDKSTIRASAKHYTNGQVIPGVGTAMGDVYILPDGGCFGGEGKCGIRWMNGAQAWFGDTITAKSPIKLVQPGSPATR